jgi:hypothetical protein
MDPLRHNTGFSPFFNWKRQTDAGVPVSLIWRRTAAFMRPTPVAAMSPSPVLEGIQLHRLIEVAVRLEWVAVEKTAMARAPFQGLPPNYLIEPRGSSIGCGEVGLVQSL